MSDTMSIEGCRDAQRQCSETIFNAIKELRQETQIDIRAIRTSQEETRVTLAQIKGHLKINGFVVESSPGYSHQRPGDETVRLHERMVAMLAAAETAATAATKATAAVEANRRDPNAMPALPWRAWVALAALFVMVVGLALIAGREGLTIWPKASAPTSLVTPKGE